MTARRIGLTQRVQSLPDRGERRDALDQRWGPWIADRGAVPIAIPNGLADPAGFVDALGLHALVLTGGNDLASLPGATDAAPERDAAETCLLEHAGETRLPVLAVCRGMQLLVQHWRGTPTRIDGHVRAVHELLVEDDAWRLRRSPVNSFHEWGIARDGVGPTLRVLATVADGTVEAVAHPTLPQVGIMWHPERPEADPADRDLLDRLVAAR